jgi:hypothetical protein
MVLVGAVAVDAERAVDVERAVMAVGKAVMAVGKAVMAVGKAEPILQQEGDLIMCGVPQHHVLRILGSFQP